MNVKLKLKLKVLKCVAESVVKVGFLGVLTQKVTGFGVASNSFFHFSNFKFGFNHANQTLSQWRSVTLCRPPLIAICRPYPEPARFARQNLSVEI